MTQSFLFQAPKTAGCTTITTNLAILDQKAHPDKKIGLLQLSGYPDLPYHLKAPFRHSLLTLEPFHLGDEWGPYLIDQIAVFKDVWAIKSPDLRGWTQITPKFFESFMHLMEFHFDRLYIDLHLSLSEPLQHYLYQRSDRNFLIISPEATSHQALEIQLKAYPFLSEKTSLILNQVPRFSRIKSLTKGLPLPTISHLPFEERTVWNQLYKGIPISCARLSRLRKALLKLSHRILNADSRIE